MRTSSIGLAASAAAVFVVLALRPAPPASPSPRMLAASGHGPLVPTGPAAPAVPRIDLPSTGVRRAAEWGTFQGTATHSAYVPIMVDPAAMALRWRWKRPVVTEAPDINAVSTGTQGGRGLVFVSEAGYSTAPTLWALDEVTGAPKWKHAYAQGVQLGPPATGNGVLWMGVDYGSHARWEVSRQVGGTPVYGTPLIGLVSPSRPDRAQIVVTGNAVYTSASARSEMYDGNYVDHVGLGRTALEAPIAAKDGLTFTYEASATSPCCELQVRGAYLGQALYTITDTGSPDSYGWPATYRAAPIAGSGANVIAFSGMSQPMYEMADYGNTPRALVDFDLNARTVAWRTARKYATAPALADGVLYAASNESHTLDAISEQTGAVLWSWTLPDTTQLFQWNVIATRNAVFVGTRNAVYAIGRDSHAAFWSYPTGGMLALSPRGTLYVSEAEVFQTGYLAAIRTGRD